MQKRILIIEDELPIQNIIRNFLVEAGYDVITSQDGITGFNMLTNNDIDLILLDIMLPKIDGYAVTNLIRSQGNNVPIIMITALGSEENQIKGFDLMVDDYITKPFSMPLVIKRIEAILRRNHLEKNFNASIIMIDDLRIDIEGHTVYKGSTQIELTAREFQILQLFLDHPGRVYTRDQIMDSVWDYSFVGDTRIINTHIKNLRKKLGQDIIKTVWGVGYKLDKKDSV